MKKAADILDDYLEGEKFDLTDGQYHAIKCAMQEYADQSTPSPSRGLPDLTTAINALHEIRDYLHDDVGVSPMYIIADNAIKFLASLPSKVSGEDWVSVKDKPLFTKDAKGNWKCTEEGNGEFWAAIPYNDHKQPDKRDLVWIRHCVVEDGIGLCVVGDTDNEPAGYQLEDVVYYIPINLPQPPKGQ